VTPKAEKGKEDVIGLGHYAVRKKSPAPHGRIPDGLVV